MKTQIYFHQYTLRSRRGLNSRSHTLEHEGALIRIDKDGAPGYACIHPWVELGDLSLSDQLKQLSEGRSSRQVNCAIECADIDRAARQAGVNLFDSLDIPLSHATIVGGMDKVEQAVESGFDTVKLKMGKDVVSNISFLKEIHTKYPELKIRVDFNGVSSFGAMDLMLRAVGGEICEQIDFIEDPLPLGDDRWQVLRDKYLVKVGIDRGVEGAQGKFDVSVIKPAINQTLKICNSAQLIGRSVVVTSYMDHPIGQCYAAYCAAKLGSQYLSIIDDRCGLVTHGLYEANPFIERMGRVIPKLSIEIEGSGLGFDDLLRDVQWRRLI